MHKNLAALEREWRAFQQRADGTVFQTFEWLATWQHHIGARNGVTPAVVSGRADDGEMLFLMPLAVEARAGVRRLTWLGSELCDYNAPLLAPNFSRRMGPDRFAPFWKEISGLLQRDSGLRYDLVDLEKMPETVAGQANPFLELHVGLHPSGAYLTHLGNDWNTFYTAKRSSATRQRDRAKHKRLSKFGEIRFVAAESTDAVARTLDTLIEQKVRLFAHMGVANMFARPGYREFYRGLATDPATRHLVHVSRLDVGSIPAAVNLGLTFRDRYYHVLASYDDGDLAKYGPGRAHLQELLRYSIDRDFQQFDFTIGDEPYKRDWCDTELRLYDYLAAVTMRGALVMAMSTAFRRAKRLIKQTPSVWRAFSKARAFMGSIGPR